jgi:hypothetical protein
MSVYQATRVDSAGFYVEPVLIEDGVIPADLDIVIIQVPDGLYRPLWTGEKWVEGKELDIEAYKQQKKDEIHQAYSMKLNSSFTTYALGQKVEFSYDETAQNRFDKQATLLALNPANQDPIPWLSRSGFVEMTRDQFRVVVNDAAEHESTLSFKLLYDEAYIDNAATKEEVDKIVAGWLI